MDNRTFAGLLAATPPTDLRIIELTAELTRPDGSFDLDAAATGRLLEALKWKLRRPPSLRELVTLVGYADDYAWFAGLVRRLFGKEAAHQPPTYAGGWKASSGSSESGTSPSTPRSSSSSWTRGTNLPGPGCGRASPSS